MFRRIYAHPEATTELFWFCHAGGAPASLFRAAKHLHQPVNLYAAILPGREERFSEGTDLPLESVLDQLEHALLETLESSTQAASDDDPDVKVDVDVAPDVDVDQRRFALIGHSFGSLICYQLAHRLLARGRVPSALTVMTLKSPDLLSGLRRASQLDDEQFLDYLSERFDGVPLALRTNAEALRLYLPIVRYDLRMLESYQHTEQPRLPIRLTAVGGTRDAAVSESDLQGWRAMTSAEFSMHMFPGGHFFPLNDIKSIVDLTLGVVSAKENAG